jgi:hypothetical protein
MVRAVNLDVNFGHAAAVVAGVVLKGLVDLVIGRARGRVDAFKAISEAEARIRHDMEEALKHQDKKLAACERKHQECQDENESLRNRVTALEDAKRA